MLFFETYLYKNSCDGLHGWALAQCYLHIAARIIFAFIVPTVFALGYKEIKAYNTDIEAFYADTNDKKFSYSREILVLFITTCIISFVANIIGRERFGSSVWLIMIPSLTFSSLLFMLGYAGHKISFQPQEQPPSLSAFSGEQASEESDQIEQLRYRIESLMEKERLYLQPELKVSDVAKYMSFSKPSVSRAMGRLKEQGYITIDPEGYIMLTESGREIAEKIYERHTVLTALLMRLGISEQTAAEDACKIEHDISDETFEAIKRHVAQSI